jgi:hypothetical protein
VEIEARQPVARPETKARREDDGVAIAVDDRKIRRVAVLVGSA